MKDTIDRLRNHFEHEVTRAKRHADLDETMQGSHRKGDRFGWIIGAAAVVAIFVVGAVALSQRTSLDTPSTEAADAVASPPTTETVIPEDPQWVEEGVTDFALAYDQDVWESEGMLYTISTKPAPNNPEVWTNSAFSSLDGGLTWTEIDHPADSVAELAVADGVLYTVSTGTNRNELNAATSQDGGSTWEIVDLPVGSDIDMVRSTGLVSDSDGGVITTTQETTNVVRRAIPSEYQGDEYMVTWATGLTEEEVTAAEEAIRAPNEADVSGLSEEERRAAVEEDLSDAELPTEEEVLAESEGVVLDDSSDGPREIGPPDAVMPFLEGENGANPAGNGGASYVMALDSNGNPVYLESFEVLGIDEPVINTTRAFSIDAAGDVSDLGADHIFTTETNSSLFLERLFDLGDGMLQTAWGGDSSAAAVSVDGTQWVPVDLDGIEWVISAGAIGDTSVIVGRGPEGTVIYASDNPLGSWSRVEAPRDIPYDDPFGDVKAHVTNAGVVLMLTDHEEAKTLEKSVVGGTILTSNDLETWSTQDLADLGNEKIDYFGSAHSQGDRVYLTGLDLNGNKIAERHLFSTVLE